MLAYGALADTEQLRDLLVAISQRNGTEYLTLSLGDVCCSEVREPLFSSSTRTRVLAHADVRPRGGERLAQVLPAGGNLANRRKQLLAAAILQNVAAGTRFHGGRDVLWNVKFREYEDFELREARVKFANELHAGAIRQRHIREYDVRLQQIDQPQSLGRAARLADDLEFVTSVDQVAYGLAQDPVLVDEEDAMCAAAFGDERLRARRVVESHDVVMALCALWV